MLSHQSLKFTVYLVFIIIITQLTTRNWYSLLGIYTVSLYI